MHKSKLILSFPQWENSKNCFVLEGVIINMKTFINAGKELVG